MKKSLGRVGGLAAVVSLLVGGLTVGWAAVGFAPVAAQIPLFDFRENDDFPPSELDLTAADPLLPEFPMTRPLTAIEQTTLAQDIAAIEQAANARFLADDRAAGVKLWQRALRLSRFLGLIEEVRALGRAGLAASLANETPQVRLILDRLNQIYGERWSEATGQALPEDGERIPGQILVLPPGVAIPDRRLWEALGWAYRQVRAVRPAIALYEPLLTEAQASKSSRYEPYLAILASLYRASFDDFNAAAAYQELVKLAQERVRQGVVPVSPVLDPEGQPAALDLPPERVAEIFYTQALITSLDRTGQFNKALVKREDLAALYRRLPLPRRLPALEFEIAQNLERVGDLRQAIGRYASVVNLARPLQQWQVAQEGLNRLGEIYRSTPAYARQPELAIATYLTALQVARQAADGFGMMEAYDRLGELFVASRDLERARTAWEQGAAIAAQLNHRQGDFARKLATLPTRSP